MTEVRGFFGLVNYYGRFFKNLSGILYPLNQLLKKDSKFYWNSEYERAFQCVKREIQTERVLAHFDTKLNLVLATQVSPYAVGAVLLHIYVDGTERPIHFTSQTLNSTQQKYAQIDKEAYVIIFEVKNITKFDTVEDLHYWLTINHSYNHHQIRN